MNQMVTFCAAVKSFVSFNCGLTKTTAYVFVPISLICFRTNFDMSHPNASQAVTMDYTKRQVTNKLMNFCNCLRIGKRTNRHHVEILSRHCSLKKRKLEQNLYRITKQDRQCQYNVILRRVRESFLLCKSNKCYILGVCASV